jgi:TPP-dependent pyruvate/acetoin dehydrogenase alpha subunit
VEAWLAKDPIRRFKECLLQTKTLTEAEIANIEREASAKIEEAVKFAMESPFPAPEEALEDVYA